MGDGRFWSRCIEVPASGDANLFVFGAAVVLQRLAFRLSMLKMTYLDALGVAGHGVDPDSPKNVSKSITVD
jgi:glutamine---fructose-6-phosphate transaminase (isomerizing)